MRPATPFRSLTFSIFIALLRLGICISYDKEKYEPHYQKINYYYQTSFQSLPSGFRHFSTDIRDVSKMRIERIDIKILSLVNPELFINLFRYPVPSLYGIFQEEIMIKIEAQKYSEPKHKKSRIYSEFRMKDCKI